MKLNNVVQSALTSPPHRPLDPRKHVNLEVVNAGAKPKPEATGPSTAAKSQEAGAVTSSQGIQPKPPGTTITGNSANAEAKVEIITSSSPQPVAKETEAPGKNRTKKGRQHVTVSTAEPGTAA